MDGAGVVRGRVFAREAGPEWVLYADGAIEPVAPA